jgi:hypothetical protein
MSDVMTAVDEASEGNGKESLLIGSDVYNISGGSERYSVTEEMERHIRFHRG